MLTRLIKSNTNTGLVIYQYKSILTYNTILLVMNMFTCY